MSLGNCVLTENNRIRELYKNFSPITKESRKTFERYSYTNTFGDTSFSLLYAWGLSIRYGFRELKDSLLVAEEGIDGKIVCIIIKDENTDIVSAVREAEKIFKECGLPLYFGYVDESELEQYSEAAAALGKKIVPEVIRGDSDYIYKTKDFISVSGRINRKKRADNNSLLRNFPDINMRVYNVGDNAFKAECFEVFDKWCAERVCQSCVYGCEKTALERFFDVFDPERHRICAAYTADEMLSFAVSEVINKDTVCYYFQKNAGRIRGLTFWLNWEMAKGEPEVKYINLGEDMGLEGLRTDKMSFHPCMIRDKYTLKII